MLETQKFVRKPFEVEAVQVTTKNIEQVAEWCKGTLVGEGKDRHIRVPVHKPQDERQSKAHVNDWVLLAGRSFKVYLPKPFERSFDQVDEPAIVHHEITGDVPQELRVVNEPVDELALPKKRTQRGKRSPNRPSAKPSPAFLAELAKTMNSQRS